MSKLDLPKLPKNFRWRIEVKENASGYRRYVVFLEKRAFASWLFGWDIVEAKFSNVLSDESLILTAEKILEDYNKWLEANQRTGIYGND